MIDDVTTTCLSMLAGVDMLTGVGMVAGGRIFSFEELILGTEVAAAARAAARAAAATDGPAGRPAGAPALGRDDEVRRLAARLVGPDGTGAVARESARVFARDTLAAHTPPALEPALDAELRRLVVG